jgi:16S rRNA (adenine1518-N6/adenine1519-N6)-dimethyltransferase
MRLSEMRQVLAESGIRLTKSLGQNFLHDANQLRRIVKAAELTRSDKVLEIGPGLGPLTELLVQRAGEVLAIEKDARLVEILRSRRRDEADTETRVGPPRRIGGFTLIHDDALEYLRREPRDWTGWKLVANLPYSVASPILVELAQAERGPSRMVATLQFEVAQRLVARPGQPDYGLLTLLVQLNYEPGEWFRIPASCFFPAPDVDSACVALVRRAHPALASGQRPAFVKIVKRAFSQRRKMMLKLLREDWPAHALAEAFSEQSLSPQTRAETVSLEQFIRLTRVLAADSACE